jgi:hypothetical protein
MKLTIRADSGRMKVPAGGFETSDPSKLPYAKVGTWVAWVSSVGEYG